MSVRGGIEAAAITLLAPLKIGGGGYLRHVSHYNGEIEGKQGIDDIKRVLAGNSPGVLVTTGAMSFENASISHRRTRGSVQLILLVISNHLRSREARNLGDAVPAPPPSDPGAYEILDDLRERLWNRELGISGVGGPSPVSDAQIIQTAELTVWRAVYSVPFRLVQVDLEEAAEVESIDTDHNLVGIENEPVNPVVEAYVPGSV